MFIINKNYIQSGRSAFNWGLSRLSHLPISSQRPQLNGLSPVYSDARKEYRYLEAETGLDCETWRHGSGEYAPGSRKKTILRVFSEKVGRRCTDIKW